MNMNESIRLVSLPHHLSFDLGLLCAEATWIRDEKVAVVGTIEHMVSLFHQGFVQILLFLLVWQTLDASWAEGQISTEKLFSLQPCLHLSPSHRGIWYIYYEWQIHVNIFTHYENNPPMVNEIKSFPAADSTERLLNFSKFTRMKREIASVFY